jgi:hypothetical protein
LVRKRKQGREKDEEDRTHEEGAIILAIIGEKKKTKTQEGRGQENRRHRRCK